MMKNIVVTHDGLLSLVIFVESLAVLLQHFGWVVDRAAMLGQVALGLAPSLDGLAVRIQRGASWQPVPARHARYSELLEQFSDFYRKLYG